MVTAKLQQIEKTEEGRLKIVDNLEMRISMYASLKQLTDQLKNGAKITGWSWHHIIVDLGGGYRCIYMGNREMERILQDKKVYPYIVAYRTTLEAEPKGKVAYTVPRHFGEE